MGIKEKNEGLYELIVEKFSEVSGLHSGIAADTVVYSANAPILWQKICQEIKLKAEFKFGLVTVEDYVSEFASLIKKSNQKRQIFLENLSLFVAEQTGKTYEPDEPIFKEMLPSSTDETQRVREEMKYALELQKLKYKIRRFYKFYTDSDSFANAKTIYALTDRLFGKKVSIHC